MGSSMAEVVKKERPVYRNIGIGQIVTYRLPPAGIVSILHRISGVILFLLLPFALFLFEQSLTSELSFDVLRSIASNWFVKLVILALSWGFLHHFWDEFEYFVRNGRSMTDDQLAAANQGVAA